MLDEEVVCGQCGGTDGATSASIRWTSRATPPPGWVRLRVEACGICGTDVEEYRDGPLAVPIHPNPLSGRCAPLTLDHETVGVVEAAGEGVALEPGTRVAVEGNMTCGNCFWCLNGTYALCPQLATLGQQSDGGLAEQMLAPAYLCRALRATISGPRSPRSRSRSPWPFARSSARASAPARPSG